LRKWGVPPFEIRTREEGKHSEVVSVQTHQLGGNGTEESPSNSGFFSHDSTVSMSSDNSGHMNSDESIRTDENNDGGTERLPEVQPPPPAQTQSQAFDSRGSRAAKILQLLRPLAHPVRSMKELVKLHRQGR
jgi:hypothetical protein